jgi:hypothetical protein
MSKRKTDYGYPGINNLGNYGRWAFAEFTDTYLMQSAFAEKIEAEFNRVIETVIINLFCVRSIHLYNTIVMPL